MIFYSKVQQITNCVLCLVCSVSAASSLHAEQYDWTEPIQSYVIDLFKTRQITYSGGKYQDKEFAYRLFIPRNIAEGKNYPLLVWTSGYGERGNDNVGQLMHLDHLFDDPSSPEKYQFFVLAMQNPPDSEQWAEPTGIIKPDEPATILMEMLEKTIRSYPIDEDKIYLSGVSSGGSACWEIALRYPDRFAAVAPMASEGTQDLGKRLNLLLSIPVWAFHCTGDPETSPDRVRSTVLALKKLGGQAHLTEIDLQSHDCWTAAFRDNHLMEWLLSHTRGKANGYPPGEVPWKWWHRAVPLAIVLSVAGLYFQEKKRRANVLRHADDSNSE